MPGFLAKNQVPDDSRCLVIIPSLSWQNLMSIELHPLLSAVGGYTKEIAPATISRWIVSTIKLAYQLTGNSRSLLLLSSISAHEVRALATSWSMYRGVTLQEIMQAVEWQSHTVFSQFYLRDCWTLAHVHSKSSSSCNFCGLGYIWMEWLAPPPIFEFYIDLLSLLDSEISKYILDGVHCRMCFM
jgi:hypothetical protein